MDSSYIISRVIRGRVPRTEVLAVVASPILAARTCDLYRTIFVEDNIVLEDANEVRAACA